MTIERGREDAHNIGGGGAHNVGDTKVILCVVGRLSIRLFYRGQTGHEGTHYLKSNFVCGWQAIN